MVEASLKLQDARSSRIPYPERLLGAGMAYSMKPSSRSASVSWVYSAFSISSVPSGA